MFIKPAKEGLKIPHPSIRHRYLAAEGEEVADKHFYWLRRLQAGDVVMADKPADKGADKPADKPAEAAEPAAEEPHPPAAA